MPIAPPGGTDRRAGAGKKSTAWGTVQLIPAEQMSASALQSTRTRYLPISFKSGRIFSRRLKGSWYHR